MKTVDEHLTGILDAVGVLPPLEVALSDAAGGVLAEPVTAPVALPPFDNSAMDGYAVLAADVVGASADAPVTLTVVGDVDAGGRDDLEVRPGACTRIMTGAPVPPGADAVVPVEATDGGTERVAVGRAVPPGHYIRRGGEDVAEGQVVLEPGVPLDAVRLGLLAAVGRARVTVRPRPRVAVLSTGNELLEPGEPIAAGRIWDANGYLLAAAVAEAGFVSHRHGIVGDDPAEVLDTVEGLLGRADAVITSGGVSMGARDAVKEVFTGRGSMRFDKVAVRPGKPQGFGMIDGRTPVFTLPGNPVSAYVSFQVFVRPALRAMQGLPAAPLPTVTARLTSPVASPPGLRHYLRAVLERRNGVAHVTPVGGQGSHRLASLASANALIEIVEDVTELDAGLPVTVLRLSGRVPEERT